MRARSFVFYIIGSLMVLVLVFMGLVALDIRRDDDSPTKPNIDLPIPWDKIPWQTFPEDFPWNDVPWAELPADTPWNDIPWEDVPWEKLPDDLPENMPWNNIPWEELQDDRSLDDIPWDSVPWGELPEDFPYSEIKWNEVPWKELPSNFPYKEIEWKEVPWDSVPWGELPEDFPYSEIEWSKVPWKKFDGKYNKVPWNKIPWDRVPSDFPWENVPWDDIPENFPWDSVPWEKLPPNFNWGVAHEHTFKYWQTTKQATCAEKGMDEWRCDCGATESHEVPATGKHNFDGDVCGTCGIMRLTVESDSLVSEYCGKPISTKHFTHRGKLLNEHTIVAEFTERTDVGIYDNVFTVKITDGSGVDVTERYFVEYVYGKITVTHKTIKVKTESYTKEYDGNEVRCEKFSYEGLAEGDKILLTFTGCRVERGKSDNTAEVKIVDAMGRDVTSNYSVEIEYGVLTVR